MYSAWYKVQKAADKYKLLFFFPLINTSCKSQDFISNIQWRNTDYQNFSST